MARRGFLVAPDPALTERCAQDGCGHAEGVHLICGCRSWPNGRPCECPGFAVLAPACPHCGRYFDTIWRFELHMRFLRLIDPRCLRAERDNAAAAAAKQRTREFRAKAGA